MSETMSSGQRSIRVGKYAMDRRLCLRLVATGVLLALMLAVALLRFQRLDALPPGLVEDEDRDGMGALRVLQGELAVFFPDVDPHGRDASVIYAAALSTLLFGRTLFAMHLPTALGSAGMVFAVFWMGRLLFGRDEEGEQATPWRGLLIGGVGAGLMAISISQTVMGRTSYNHITQLPLLLTLCLGLLWRGWKERSWRRVALAGACAGLLPYTYPVARFTPVLFVFFGLSFLAPLRAVNWGKVRQELRWAALFAGVAALVAAPLLVHFALHPEHLFLRSKHLWVFEPSFSQRGPLGLFLINVWEHLMAFGIDGDPHIRSNYAGQPMLNPVAAVFFWLGVGMTVRRWQRSAYRLLLLWLVIMLVPGILAWEGSPPGFIRMLAATPAIYLLAGVGVWEAFSFLRGRFFREDATRAAVVVASVISAALLAQGIVTYRTYFDKWAADPRVHMYYVVPRTTLFQMLNAQLPEPGTVYLVPNVESSYSYGYLNRGGAQVHFFNPSAPDLVQMVESELKEYAGLSTVKVVAGVGDSSWAGFGARRFAMLLNKYGRYLGSDEYPDILIHSFTDISFDRPWTLFDELEPLTVEYDGGIALQGFALGQGEQQLSSEQLLSLGENRFLWLVLKWQLAPGVDIDYAISVRLHDAEGGAVHQKDSTLWQRFQRPAVGEGSSGQFDTLVPLDLPADLQPGEYELRLVVYDTATLKPTVELGVWEAETTLTRLRLAETQ